MITLHKKPGKDFIVLNLTDPQMNGTDWAKDHVNRKVLIHTVTELVNRTDPDLITVCGDIAPAGDTASYDAFAEFMDTLGLPWTTVWGNHDHDADAEYTDSIADRYLTHPGFLYEKGDPVMGNGNFVIRIEQEGRTLAGLILLDAHNGVDYIGSEERTHPTWDYKLWQLAYSSLYPEQLDWYREQIGCLHKDGCRNTAMILHIPIYAYHTAADSAFRPGVKLTEVTLEQSYGKEIWNPGYEDSYGVQHERICSYPEDDGVFALIRELDSTKYIIAGHDHENNTVIRHDGVYFVYCTKTGTGAYSDPAINGGTVLTVNDSGIASVHHEYVDISHLKG
ncbi:MAG: metallophosphoesterase [Clostridia bacterium]|nr:metallophosphoesterase [Clostridia bacterium]